MAINLLPSEHKTKFKKQKSESSQQKIEMTSTEKFDNKESGIKKAGVLSFFKQSIAKPKEEKKEEQIQDKARSMPEKKVSLKQKISYKNILDGKVPKVEYHVPDRKPLSEKKSEGLFSFGKKSKGPELKDADRAQMPKVGIKTTIFADQDKESFPKYDSINTEKVASPAHKKFKKTKVVEVTSGELIGSQKKSAWQKFKAWVAGLFSGKTKEEFKDPDNISKLEGFPKPKDGPIEAIEEKTIIDKRPEIEYESKKQEIDKKIGQPKEAKEKGKLFSYATPIEVEEEITVEKPADKQESRPEFKPESLSYDQIPPKQEKIVASNFLDQSTNINMDKVIHEEGQVKGRAKKEVKKGLWQRLMDWLANLFQKKEKDKIDMPLPPAPLPEKTKPADKEEAPVKPDLYQKFQSDKKEEKYEAKPEPNLVAPAPMPEAPLPPKPDIKKEFVPEELQREQKINELPPKDFDVPPPPKPAATISEQPTPDKKNEDQEEEKLSRPMGFNGEQVNWEVNLIPEEAQEKEVPVSKILILVASVITAIGLVFGGWIWANYYYNTITVTIGKVDQEIADLQTQIAEYGDVQDKAESLQQQIENVELLLEKHVYWSEFFNQLEMYTNSDVYYKNMTADINGNITLAAVTDDYESVIRQLYVFREADDFVTDVTISNIARQESDDAPSANQETEETEVAVNNEEAVDFTVNLTINPSLFYFLN